MAKQSGKGKGKGDAGARAPREKLYSTSELARLSGLDRNTVIDRLQEIEPAESRANLNQYRLKDALPALIVGASRALDAAKLRRAQADAGKAELALKRASREVVDVEEARDGLTQIFKKLHSRLYHRLPGEIAGALYKAADRGEVSEVLRVNVGKVFNDLRDDITSFLGSDTGGDTTNDAES